MRIGALKKILIFILFSISLVNNFEVKADDHPSTIFENGVEHGNIFHQAQLIHKLVESGVEVFVNVEGIIYFRDSNKKIVEELDKQIDGLGLVQFKEKRYATLFVTLLEINKIEYLTATLCKQGTINIYYDRKYDTMINNSIMPSFRKAITEGIKIN